MEQQETIQDLVRRYFDEDLNSEELAAFQQRMATDEAFADEVTSALVVLNEEGRLKEELMSIHEEVLSEKKSDNDWFSWGKVAAVLLLFILPAGIWWGLSGDETDVYATYFEPYPSTTVRDPQLQSHFEMAMQWYDQNNYSAAIAELNQIADRGYLEDLYLGISYLALEKPKEAIPPLEKVLTTDHDFIVTTKWYLALAYDKAELFEKAEPLFVELADEKGGFHQGDALEILKNYPPTP